MEKKRIIKRYDNKYFNKHKGHFIYTHTNNHNYIDFATLFSVVRGKIIVYVLQIVSIWG